MALEDALGIPPQGVVNDLIAEQQPSYAQNGVPSPQRVVDDLIRGEYERRAKSKAPAAPAKASPDFSHFGRTENEASPGIDFSQFGSEAPAEEEAAPEKPAEEKRKPPTALETAVQTALRPLGIPADPVLGKSIVQGVTGPIGHTLKAGGRWLQPPDEPADMVSPTPTPNGDADFAPQKTPAPVMPNPTHPLAAPLATAGQAVQDFGEKQFPLTDAEKGTVTSMVGRGIGSVGPLMLLGIANPPAGVALGSIVFGASSADETYEDAIKKGATEAEANQAAGLSGAVNAALGAVPVAAVLKPIFKYLPEGANLATRMLAEAGKNGVVFTGVGEAQEYLGQQIAKIYNPRYVKKLEGERDAVKAQVDQVEADPARAAANKDWLKQSKGAIADYDEQIKQASGYNGDIKRMIASFLTGSLLGVAHVGADAAAGRRQQSDVQPEERGVAPHDGKDWVKADDKTWVEKPPHVGDDWTLAQDVDSGKWFWHPPLGPGDYSSRGPKPGPEPKPGSGGAGAGSAGGAGAQPGAGAGSAGSPAPEPFKSTMTQRARRKYEERAAAFDEFKPDDIASWSDEKLREYTREKDVNAGGATDSEVLRRAGYTDDEINNMSAGEAKAAAAEAKSYGVHAGEEPGREGTRGAPSENPETAAAAANADHTHAQGEANNTQRGHMTWNGMGITIEAAKGGMRRGTAPDGTPFETQVGAHYGYWKDLPKGADGQAPDVFVGDHPSAPTAFVIDELDPKSGKFRQTKSFVGFQTFEQALDAYLGTSSKDASHVGGMAAFSIDEFKTLARAGGLGKPVAAEEATKAGAPAHDGQQPAYREKPAVAETARTQPSDVDLKVNTPATLDHIDAVEAAIAETGTDPSTVDHQDVRSAAEIHAREGVPADEAFPVAVVRRLVEEGHLNPKDVREALGDEAAKDVLQPGHASGHELPAETPGAAAPRSTAETGAGKAGRVDEGSRVVERQARQGVQPEKPAGREGGGPTGQAARTGHPEKGPGAELPAAGGERDAKANVSRIAADAGRGAATAALIGPRPKNAALGDHDVTAADGSTIRVTPVVVEAKDLIASSDAGYDQSLQPRNRDRAAPQAQIREIATRLNPERLGYSAEADRGAPIVGPDHMVESGNGRVAALRTLYRIKGANAQKYRDWLIGQGVDVEKFDAPILVRQRRTDLTPDERKAFTVAANQAATLAMSAPERAMADADHLTPDMLGLIRDGENLNSLENRGFIRAFSGALPPTERGALTTAEGHLSAEGLTRARNAILARAYGDADVLARITESTDDMVKSISNALTTVAPAWAKLRADIEAGRVHESLDVTADLMEAVKRTADLRARGQKLDDWLRQQDAFDAPRGEVEAFMRMFYNPAGRRAAGAPSIAEGLRFVAEEAAKVTTDPRFDLGTEEVTINDIQRAALAKGARIQEPGPGADAGSRLGEGRPAGRPAGQGERGQGSVAGHGGEPGRRAGLAEDEPRYGTEPGAEGKPQLVLPGAERVSSADLAKRRAAEPLKPKVAQKPLEGGLFGETPQQLDLVDEARKAPAKPDAAMEWRGKGRDDAIAGRSPQLPQDYSDWIQRRQYMQGYQEARAEAARTTAATSTPDAFPDKVAKAAPTPQIQRKAKPAAPSLFDWERPDERGSTEKPGAPPLDRASAGKGARATAGGTTGRRADRGGEPSAGRDRAPDEAPSLFGGRGEGGGAPEIHHPAAGGIERVGRAGSGARGERARVSEEPAGDVKPQEAPSVPAVNYRITDETELGKGSEAVKFRDNVAAIETLKKIESEGRRATPAEQRALARYVGWGGLANAFADVKGEHKPDWKERGTQLADLLTKEKLTAARHSTTNAHYTSKTVIDAMWKAAQRLGFKGGLALETSMGTGNFLGLVPDAIAGQTRFVGVELDSITARIAKLLYPQDTVLHSGFQRVPLPDGEFVLSIGNPPFGSESLRFQAKPDLHGLSIHNQFFLAALDALAPGGVHINVVSRYLLDAKDKTAREKMAVRAKLLGAIRLPDTAFKENARTEVVTDIVVMQRRTPDEERHMQSLFDASRAGGKSKEDAEKRDAARAAIEEEAPWIKTAEVRDPLGGEPMPVNRYFADNPKMVMGRLERSGTMRRDNELNVKLDKPGELAAMLDQAVARLPKDTMDLGKDVVARTVERFATLSDSIKIALAGHEPGHVSFDDNGRLTQVSERETPNGDFEPTRRVITPDSPWSRHLMMDSHGRWYTMEPKVDAKGAKVKDGSRLVYERKTFPNNEVPASMRLGAPRFERLTELAKLRDLLRRQIELETQDAKPAVLERNRGLLAAAYRGFADKHGLLNEPRTMQLLNEMPDGPLLMSLESGFRPAVTQAKAARVGGKVGPATARPAAILSKRVIPKYEPPTKAATPADAIAIVLSERGRLDPERVAGLLGIPEDKIGEVLGAGDKPLAFFDPETKTWEPRNTYLSGQVRRKLAAARGAGLDKNVRELEAVQPERWTADQVTPLVGSNWIPPRHYEDFAKHLLGTERAAVHYSEPTNSFNLLVGEYGADKQAEWGTPDMPADAIVRGMLNSRLPRVMRETSDTPPRRYEDKDASALVALKAKEIADVFSNWVFKDVDRRRELVDIYNDKFNTRTPRQHDGSHLMMPGKNPEIALRRHVKNAIWRGIYERNMLVDHVVGAGKTFTAIGRVMERRRMGLSRKPMIAVPNHLVEQWASEAYRLFPGAKVLAAGKNQFDRKNRRKLFAKIATGDYDMVIVPHSSFGFIGISPETELRFLEDQLRVAHEAVTAAEEEAASSGLGGFRKPFTVKEAERLVTNIETRMDTIRGARRDNMLTFEQMGVDDLTVDEAHEFKNLFYSSRMQGVRGMGDKTGSQKAFDLYNKVKVLNESPTGSVAFLTGTPISNSAVEMYTMMRYLAAKDLRELGMEHFDAWRSQFVSAEPKWEPTESGGLKEVTRLGRSWSNMRALMDLYHTFTDSVTQEDINRWYAEDNNGAAFPIPKVKGGERQGHVVKPTPAQTQILHEVIAGFEGLEDIADPDERNAERLRLMDRARKVSLDARAVDPRNPSKEEGGKLEAISDEVARIHKAWTKDKGTQLIFLDRSVPKARGDDKIIARYDELTEKRDAALAAKDETAFRAVTDELDKFNPHEIETLRHAQTGGWNAYDQIKQNLIKRGVPADEIRFIQEANNDAEKKAMFDAVNAGEVRVLIGSTARMGAGTNVQERIVGLHHGDVTWKPSDIEQREGRGIRQGNSLLDKYKDFELEIHNYVTERTVDAKMWDLNSEKLRMINGIRKYDGAFNMEFADEDAVSMAEIAALASGDPLLMERVKLAGEIEKLEMQERGFQRKMNGIEDAVDQARRVIQDYPAKIVETKAASDDMVARAAALRDTVAARRVSVAGKDYATAYDAMQAANAEIERQKAGDENGKYAITVDGNTLTSKDAISSAVNVAMGDNEPFEAKIGGETFRRRFAAAKAMAEKIKPALTGTIENTGRTVKLGRMLGADLDATIEPHGKEQALLILSLNDGGKTVAATPHGVVIGRQGELLEEGRSVQSAIHGLEKDAASILASRGDWMQARVDAAKKALPELLPQIKQASPVTEKLTGLRDKLRDLIQTLDARTRGTDEPDRADFKALLERDGSVEDILAHPYVARMRGAARDVAPTATPAQIADPAWRAARTYNFDGEEVHGFDQAAKRLAQRAAEYSTEGPVRNERKALFLIGPPAASKSYFSEMAARDRHAAIIDADDAKAVVPENKGGIGSTAVHEEGSALSKEAMLPLVRAGANLIFPKVGLDPESLRKQIQLLKEIGYDVDLVSLSVRPEEAVRRGMRRFLQTGRFVPPENFLEAADKPDRTYHILKVEGDLSDAAQIDVNPPRGEHVVLDGEGPLADAFRAGGRYGPTPDGGLGADRGGAEVPQGLSEPENRYAQTNTPEFKRWFGDSKVVDADGRPLVVYHATDAEEFGAFEHTNDIGFHFGSVLQANDRLKQTRNEGPDAWHDTRIVPVYLSIQNPLRLPDLHDWSGLAILEELRSAGVITAGQQEKAESRGIDIDREFVAKTLAEKGYDGIVYANMNEGTRPLGPNEHVDLRVEQYLTGEDRYAAVFGHGMEAMYIGYGATPAAARFSGLAFLRNNGKYPGGDSYIALRPNQIKSATGNVGAFDPNNPNMLAEPENRYAAPPFYSAVLRAAESAKTEKASPNQWIGTLRNTPGVKPEELEWLGVEQWLRDHKAPVTKSALADYIRAHQVEVREVTHGGPVPAEAVEKIRVWASKEFGEPDASADLSDELLDRMRHGDAEAIGAAEGLGVPNELLQPIYDSIGDGATKFSGHVLPGGENYRELLLTLPPKHGGSRYTVVAKESPHPIVQGATHRSLEVTRDDGHIQASWTDTPVGRLEAQAFADRLSKDDAWVRTDINFKGQHWDELNVVAHVRFNDRTIDGRRTLFLEEIQSDWLQKGKREGYEITGKNTDQERQLGVPDAPFKTTWPELALKRMIRYAAEHGYDQVAWTSGATQADRYDMSKQVEDIRWHIRPDDKVDLDIHMLDGTWQKRGGLGPTELADNIGKELADKVEKRVGAFLPEYAGKSYTASGVLSKVDLKVGGEGMAGFYDKMLPAAANKLGKKFGAKAGRSQIALADDEAQGQWGVFDGADIVNVFPSRTEAQEYLEEHSAGDPDAANWTVMEPPGGAIGGTHDIHTLPVTPALRQAAMGGFALFEPGRRADVVRRAMAAPDILPPFRPEWGKPLGASAQRYVVDMGKITGNEHLIAIDGAGKVVAQEMGGPMHIGFPDALMAKLADAKNAIVAHHNHPNNTGLSSVDVAVSVMPGLAGVWAHGHDGRTARVSLTPLTRAVLAREGKPNDAQRGWLYTLHVAIQSMADKPLKAAVKAGALTTLQASELAHQVAIQAMHRAGLINYHDNRNFDADIAKFGLDPFIEKGATAISGSMFNGRRPQLDRIAGTLRHPGDLGTAFEGAAGPARDRVAPSAGRGSRGANRRGGARPEQLRLPGLAAQRNRYAAGTPPPRSAPPGTVSDAIEAEVLADRLDDRNWPKLAKISRALGFGRINTAEVRVQAQDKFLRWKRVEQAVARTAGPVAENLQTYLAESLYYGRAGEQLERLEKDHIDPIIDEVKKQRLNLEDIDWYLMARHAPERNAALRKINRAIPDPSGMSDADAARIIDQIRARGWLPKYQAVERRVRALIDQTRQTLVDGGLISQDTADQWAKSYQHYVPLRGWAEAVHAHDEATQAGTGTGRGFDIRGEEARRAMGRTTRADSPLAYTFLQAQTAVVRAEKNLVGQTALRFVEANPDPALWQVDKGSGKRVIDPTTGLVKAVGDPMWTRRDDAFAVKVNGEPHHILFKGEYGRDLARALKNLGTANMPAVMRAIGAFTRLQARLATSWNPDFMIPNFVRDAGEAFINLQAEDQRRIVKRFGVHLRGSIGGAFLALSGKTGGRYAQAFRDFDKAGGRIRFFGMENADDIKAHLAKSMRRLQGGPLNSLRSAGEHALEAIEIVNGAIENGTRLAAFMAARDVGMSDAKAADLARNLTVNFNKKGELGTYISALYMFANAAMQGSARMLRALKSNRARRMAYALAALGAALGFYNLFAGGNDDDGVPYYTKIPSWERDTNILLMWPKGMGHDGKYIKIPLPYGYSFFHVIGARGAAMFAGGEKPKKAIGAMLKSTLDAFDPLGKDENNLAQFAPTAVRPIIHNYTNENWTGRPINPQPEPWNKHEPKSSRFFRSSSEFAQGAAERLNRWTGGTRHEPGMIDVSPGTIDYAVNFITGGLGRFVANTAVTGYRAIEGMDWDPQKTPIVRRFVGDANNIAADRGTYFDDRNELQAIKAHVDAYRKTVANSQASADAKAEAKAGMARLRAENAPELMSLTAFKTADSERKRIAAEVDKVKANAKLDPPGREALIKELEEKERRAMATARKVLKENRAKKVKYDSRLEPAA